MTGYCCLAHPDQAVSWRGGGCPRCSKDTTATGAGGKPRRKDDVSELVDVLRRQDEMSALLHSLRFKRRPR